MKTLYVWAILFCTLPLLDEQLCHAQLKPSSEVAKSFLDFYFEGQGKGAVLADLKVCTDVANADCVETVDPSLLQVGMKYKIWMVFVVPQGDVLESLSVQFSKDGEIKFARQLSAKGSVRYRTWRNFDPTEAGVWEVKVLHNREVEVEELGQISLVVSQ